jgi:hypothetical protein
MPLQRFDMVVGRTPGEVQSLLAAAQRAVVAAFRVPASDLYQIVHQHPRHDLAAEDTGLGIERSDRLVFLSMTSRPRDEAAKLDFYRRLCAELEANCGMSGDDLIVSITINGDADWSFGRGRAQFITGEL